MNQANNALLMSRLQLLEQGVISTPMGSSSGIGRLTPQAPPSAAMNHTAVVTPLESGTVKRMRVRELDAPSRPSDVPLSVLQQGDTDMLAAIKRGDENEDIDNAIQETCDPREQSTISPTKPSVSEPEPTNITPSVREDHDDDGDTGGPSASPTAQDQTPLRMSGHKSESTDTPKREKGNTPTNEMMLGYEFGAVAVLNRSGNDNLSDKIPITSFASPNNTRKSFDNGGGSVRGNGERGGDGGNGDGGGSSNDSSESSRGNRKGSGDPDGGGGDDVGSSTSSHKVWESIPGENVLRRFLSLLEAQLIKEQWSKDLIWRALVHVKNQWVFPRVLMRHYGMLNTQVKQVS